MELKEFTPPEWLEVSLLDTGEHHPVFGYKFDCFCPYCGKPQQQKRTVVVNEYLPKGISDMYKAQRGTSTEEAAPLVLEIKNKESKDGFLCFSPVVGKLGFSIEPEDFGHPDDIVEAMCVFCKSNLLKLYKGQKVYHFEIPNGHLLICAITGCHNNYLVLRKGIWREWEEKLYHGQTTAYTGYGM